MVCVCAPGYLDGIFVILEYKGIVEDMIHAYKYEYVRGVGSYIERIVGTAFEHNALSRGTLVPVPMTQRKYSTRGFNQAQEIAGYIARSQGATCVPVLKKTKDTIAQMTLSREDRARNARGAYAIAGNSIPDHVVLVDDVMTTGSTLNECARVLKDAGTREVYAVVLAHATMATTAPQLPSGALDPPSSPRHQLRA